MGTNLVIALAKDKSNVITVVSRCCSHWRSIEKLHYSNINFVESGLTSGMEIDRLLNGQDVVYHLYSTTVPSSSNRCIGEELKENIIFSSNLLESCAKRNVTKVVFLSSGGTVYGKEAACPIPEDTPTNPITAYGIQKVTTEKLLYLYNYMYGMDYRIIRLSNPYGPYQRPNGALGAVTTFIYKALKGEEISVYGDGTVVRDYIYIDDAIKGIINIANGDSKYRVFNLGSGHGNSLNQVLFKIQNTLGLEINVVYKESRAVDVPVNYLDISRYESCYGKINPISLSEGIMKTAEFMKKEIL